MYNILDSVTGKNRSGALESLWRVTLHDLCKLLLLFLDFIHGIESEPLVLTLGWEDNQLLAIYAVFGILGCCSTSSDLPFQRVRLYSLQCRLRWRWNESSSSTNRRGQGWSTHSNGCKYSHLSKHLWNVLWLANKFRATFSTNQRLNQNQLWLVQSISRAWLPLHAFASRCDWFIWVCSRTVIGRRGNYFYVKILCGLTSKYPNLPLVIQYFLWLQPQADRNFARVTLCFLVATFKKRPSSFLFFAGKI